MKHFFFFLLMVSAFPFYAQLDTNFTLTRFGTPAIFSYKKFSSAEQYKNHRPSGDFPQYSFNENQFNRIKGLLGLFVTNESEFVALRKTLSQKDSIYLAKTAVYQQMDSIQALRTKNFELAYNAMERLNQQYNQQLINCKDVAEKENRRSKFSSTMFGVLAGVTAGVILGVTLK